MSMKLLCFLGHSWQTRMFAEGVPVRHCVRLCGVMPQYFHDGKWIAFEIPEKYEPAVRAGKMRGA